MDNHRQDVTISLTNIGWGILVKLDIMSQFKKFQWTYLIPLPIILLFLLYFLPINFSWRVSKAQDLIKTAYQDDQQIYLAKDLSVYHVQELLNITNRLADETGQVLQEEADTIYRKYRNLHTIKELAQIEDQDIEAIDPESLRLNEQLTIDYWNQHGQLLVWKERDAFTDKIDDLYRSVSKMWKPVARIEESLSAFPDKLPEDENQLEKILDDMIALDETFQSCQHLEHCQFLAQDRASLLNAYLKDMEVKQAKSSYSKPILDRLYQNDIFFSQIKDTNLDHRPKVAVTFDDGPNEDFTPQVLDILDEYGVKGTFFVVGRNVDQVPHIAQEILKRGHDIGNHSYSHPTFLEMTDDEVLWEINATQDIIENHTGYRPKYYRMPFGDGGKRVYDLIDNMTSIMWNTDTYDWGLETAEEIYDYTLPLFHDDMLVLMHDTSQKSVDAFALLIETLVEENYKFVGPDDLNYDERYREL